MNTPKIDFYLSALAFVLLLALLGTACSPVKNPAAPPAEGNPLEGTAWTLTGMGGSSPLPGSTVTLSFEAEQLGGNAGCNSYGGAYQVTGSQLIVNEVAQTEMACMEPQGVMAQESAYVSLLAEAQSYDLNGDTLTIRTAGGQELIFTVQAL